MIRKETRKIKQNLRGGKGTVEVFEILSEKELMGHGKMYAKVVVKPHSSVGWHQHLDDTEPYYIIQGEGVFVDNDGSKTRVVAGDICLIEVGQFHSIENNTDEDLVMIALVINK